MAKQKNWLQTITGEKGAVGKTTFGSGFVEYYCHKDLPHTLIDVDETNPVTGLTYAPEQHRLDLPVGGDYEVTFKQPDADTEGDVEITLTNPTTLELDAPVTAERKNVDRGYYVYTGDADFNVVYAQDGALPFTVTVNTFSEFYGGSVLEGATISGELVNQGSLGTVTGGTTYIIIVKEGFYFSFDEDTVVNYNLAVVTPAQ